MAIMPARTYTTITDALKVARENLDDKRRMKVEKEIRDARGILFSEDIPISNDDLQQKLVIWSGQVSAWTCLVDRFPTTESHPQDWRMELQMASFVAMNHHNAISTQGKRHTVL